MPIYFLLLKTRMNIFLLVKDYYLSQWNCEKTYKGILYFPQILITNTTCLFNKILYSGKSISNHSTELIRAEKDWGKSNKKIKHTEVKMLKNSGIFIVSFWCFLFRSNVGMFTGCKAGGKQQIKWKLNNVHGKRNLNVLKLEA